MSHLPKTINISNTHTASECTLSLSGDSEYLNELLEKKKQELAEELIWLRETSKTAIQEYVNEVEYLQRQCAVYIEAEVQFNAQLTDSRAKEEVWRLRCFEAEAEKIQTMSCEYDKSHADSLPRPQSAVGIEEVNKAYSLEISNGVQKLSEKKTLQQNRIKMWSRLGGNLPLMEEDAKILNKLPTTSIRSCSNNHPSGIDEAWYKAIYKNTEELLNQSMMSPRSMKNLHDDNSTNIPDEDYFIERVERTADKNGKENQPYLFVNARYQGDLSLAMSSRDQVIVSLEQTLNQQLGYMQHMHAEIECLIDAQGIKEKILSISHTKKEEYLKKLIKSLRERLVANEMSTKEHNEALLACKLYIQELTDELERMLNIVKRAEDNGFVVDCNLSS